MNSITHEEATTVTRDYYHAKYEFEKACNEAIDDIEACVSKICEYLRNSHLGRTSIDEGLKVIRDDAKRRVADHNFDVTDGYDILVFMKHIMKLYGIEE